MPAAKPLSKEDLIRAMKMTKSNRAAARYLRVSYQHYKKFAKIFVDEKTGKTFFDLHLNQSGKGIRKHFGTKEPLLKDLMNGELFVESYDINRYKDRLVQEGYIEEKCNVCGFKEQRVNDYRVPLLISFKDYNKKNWKIENIELLCYNHYFLYVGNIFNDKQIEGIQEYKDVPKTQEVNWELDENMLEHFKELGLVDSTEDEDDFISRI